jgi:predicted NUDIX family NTP pyrophosphohydrolase
VTAKRSAGLLMYRRCAHGPEVLLVHPGGPFYAKKDLGVWSVPKGEIEEGADELTTAIRELREETGIEATGPYLPLGEVRQKSGKTVVAWAFEGDCDPAETRSNTFRLEWPPGSGRFQEFPEVDRAAFFDLAEARRRILPAQSPLLDRLEAGLGTVRNE